MGTDRTLSLLERPLLCGIGLPEMAQGVHTPVMGQSSIPLWSRKRYGVWYVELDVFRDQDRSFDSAQSL